MWGREGRMIGRLGHDQNLHRLRQLNCPASSCTIYYGLCRSVRKSTVMTLPRCSLCPRHCLPIPPSGPTPSRLLFLGEAPSTAEDRDGIPFCGKTGDELNQTYLPILGVPRSSIFVTNVCLCSRRDYSNPDYASALSCANTHLGPTLARVKPEVIVVMGAVACSLWPEISLNLDHGLPCAGKWGAWRGIVWPMYHPSAGIHATSFMIPLQTDFAALKEFLRRLDNL